MEAFIENVKEWLVDIALFLLLTVVTAGLDARNRVGVSCDGQARVEAKSP